ncbi:substrate-binding domain-containing protein [Azospirillum thermophilum]|uniref:Sugar ABC transporter substrate-binding protein n=1 Tax=Azospirillum thermophilum TaxID=2202148 RepID=A0A2S2CZ31_9PROT|nr:substrate-binding domain-containing protein [Azospirillum thermophilum]AWK89751.1 sugar ABC transporter substrate-binding protein [Azospirillum thermophilum]
MSRKPLALALGAMLAAGTALTSLTALAAGEKIVVSFQNMSEPFVIAMNRALQDEAKKLDVSLIVVDAQSNSPKQSADLANAVVQGAKGVIVAPNDAKALAPAIDDVQAEKIPVVTVDRRVEGTARPVAHVGADNVAGGRTMAAYVQTLFPNGARIVHLSGQPGSSSAIDRAKGFRDGITAAGAKYQIIADQTANWRRAEGLTVTEGILTANSANPPDVVVASNDDMALGALEAVRSVLGAKSKVQVIGFDALPETLDKVRKGEIAGTVEQSPSTQIRTALNTLVDHIRKGTELKSLAIEPTLITRDNLDKADRIAEVN